MAQGNNQKVDGIDSDSITLGVLSAIEEDDRATQRAISLILGSHLALPTHI